MRITISRRLYGSFGLVVLIIVALGAVSWRSGATAETGLGDVTEMLNDVRVVGVGQSDMLMVRMEAKDFLISNSEVDAEAYKTWRDDLRKQLATADQSIQKPYRRERLAAITEKFQLYDEAFTRVKDLIRDRNVVLADTLDVVGPRMTQAAKDFQYGQIDEGDMESVSAFAPVLNDVFEARLYAFKYLRGSSPEALQRVLSELEKAQGRLPGVIEAETDPEKREELIAIQSDLAAYADGFARVNNYLEQRNDLVLNTMDVIGPEIATLFSEIVDSLTEDSTATQAEANQAIASGRAVVFGAVCVAVVLASALAFLISRGIASPLARFNEHFKVIASGDFTKKFSVKSRDEIGDLGKGLNALIAQIADMIRQVQSAAGEVAASSTEIAASSEEMSAGLGEQTQQVTQISSAIEQMSTSIVEVARKSGEASASAKDSGTVAEEGGKVVAQTIEDMQGIRDAVSASATSVTELGRRGEQIGEIIVVINDIADQTNLLALNAAIEAARAGEHGRGFAVVADEVRKLADRTTKATDEIAESITAMQQETGQAVERMNTGTEQVGVGVERAGSAGESLKQIVGRAHDVSSLVESIAAAAEEQSAASEQITRSIDSINAVAQQSAAGASEAASAASGLSSKAEQLKELAERFKVN